MTLPYFLKCITLNSFCLFNRHQVAFVFQHMIQVMNRQWPFMTLKIMVPITLPGAAKFGLGVYQVILYRQKFIVWGVKHLLKLFSKGVRNFEATFTHVYSNILCFWFTCTQYRIIHLFQSIARLLFCFLNINYTCLRIL